ncbi:MAG: ABC transporter substrate-binding protein [Alphaproteobacteria bacterium]|nr:ABC transporter substrate-binding protein [Alphaproteobacteria bacterium]
MAHRIASLLPSATEIVAALGAAHELVARSHECDHPPGIEDLPAVTSARLDPLGSSAEIHQRMEAALADVLSVYRVDAEGLRELAPDVIVTQAQCEVCAVSEDDVVAALAAWGGEDGERPGAQLVSLTAADLAGVYEDIAAVARALGREAQGATLVSEMTDRLDAIAAASVEAGWKPRVMLIEWMAPVMAGGNWMPELIEIAGGEALFAEAGAHSPWVEWADVAAADPEAILIAPCGFDLARIEADLPALTGLAGWGELKAVRSGRVAAADGNAFFNRPGPRLVDTAEIIAEVLHPDVFDFGHEGVHWRRLGGGR